VSLSPALAPSWHAGDDAHLPRAKRGVASREIAMSYGLPAFCADLTRILKDKAVAGLPEIAEQLKRLVGNPEFVAETFMGSSAPQRLLHHDAETDAHVLAHIQPAGKSGVPHSHGTSWAVYGNARGDTEMIEWRRVNAEREEHAVLEAADRYFLRAGQTRAYGPHVIHSTAHPDGAWVIRVTGTNLEKLPRYYFRPKKDKLLPAPEAVLEG
jgi:predicted metal-dependent enzyme (double-stranded beta helix superfamily)